MKAWIAFWNILKKDMHNYYLKPPNISWGMIFPVAWTLMVFLKSGRALDVLGLLPGVMCLSVLFGTTSMLAVTITFERRSRSFERLLIAPIDLNLLMLAKTTGAIVFGIFNGFVPVGFALFMTHLGASTGSWCWQPFFLSQLPPLFWAFLLQSQCTKFSRPRLFQIFSAFP